MTGVGNVVATGDYSGATLNISGQATTGSLVTGLINSNTIRMNNSTLYTGSTGTYASIDTGSNMRCPNLNSGSISNSGNIASGSIAVSGSLTASTLTTGLITQNAIVGMDIGRNANSFLGGGENRTNTGPSNVAIGINAMLNITTAF